MATPEHSIQVRHALEGVRECMYKFYPERRQENPFPLEFWRIEDEDIFFEVLNYLPLHMQVNDPSEDLTAFPEGFRLAYPVFSLEDDYQMNGWTALTNAGEWLLPSAIAAYERMNMASEARALAAALESVRRDPEDEDAAEAAYKSVANEFRDDEVRAEALLAFFRENARLFEPV